MNQLKENFARLKTEIARQKGDFTLFALFLREDAADRWDLVVAAPWADHDRDGTVKFLISEIERLLGSQELIRLSRIIVADTSTDQFVHSMTSALAIVGENSGPVEVRDSDFFGIPIHHAVFFAAKRPEVPVTG